MLLRTVLHLLVLVLLALPCSNMGAAAQAPNNAEPARPDLAGRWRVQERDNPDALVKLPLLSTDKDYEMVVTQNGSEIVIAMPSENMRFDPARLNNGIIDALGRHPTRGPVTLRLNFDGATYRLSGLAKFQYELFDRKLDATLPEAEARQRSADLQRRTQSAANATPEARLQEALRASEARLAEEQRRTEAAERRVRELERTVNDLGARKERDSDRQLAQLRQERREQDVLVARLRNEITASHDQGRASAEAAERRIAALGNDLQVQKSESDRLRGDLQAQKSEADKLRGDLEAARSRAQAPQCDAPQ